MSQKNKILVVEDDAVVGADLTKTLTSFGYEVVGPLTSGEEVLKDIESISPDFILMDINLSGKLDGIQTAERLQDKLAVPVVFLSALNDEGTLQRAKLVNPYGYLIKPFEGAELRTTIEITLQRFANEKRVTSDPGNDFSVQDDDAPFVLTEAESTIDKIFTKLKLFEGISKSNLEILAHSCQIKDIPAGEYFIHEDGEAADGFIPLSGRISVMKSSTSGKQLIVALIGPGDNYGILSSISGLAGSISARAQVDSKCIWIPRNKWASFLEQEPQIFQNLCEALAERLTAANALSCSLAHARVEARIIGTLLALIPQFGKSYSKDSKEGRIFITRKELSELTGTTPETAIRVTKALERQHLLDLTRPGIIKIPDLKLLEEAATN